MKYPTKPFVLLHGSKWASNNSPTYCDNFISIHQTHKTEEVKPILDLIQEKIQNGFMVVGFMSYEAASAFNLPVVETRQEVPLCWFGVASIDELKPWNRPTLNDPKKSNIEIKTPLNLFSKNFDSIKQNLADGDTYQVNYTIRSTVSTDEDVLSWFIHLSEAQPVPYSALICADDWSVISLSPELFLSKVGHTIESKPMKGTISKGKTLQEDEIQKCKLESSVKDQAENIMIVDMVRNDLGKICEFGSIQVENLFHVESYKTVLQMTSTVKGKLNPEQSLTAILQSTFPPASITGAPKKKTMDLIQQYEDTPRGPYCGSIMFLKPNGDFTMNVAIRTLYNDKTQCILGLGSGIVWDSKAVDEYAEIQTKSTFLTTYPQQFQLIETIRFHCTNKLLFLDEHLNRLESSSKYWSYPYNKENVKSSIDKYTANLTESCALRILLDHTGKLTITHRLLTGIPKSIKILLTNKLINSRDPFYYHKTTNRFLYNHHRSIIEKTNYFEIIYQNTDGFLTEGTITNLFIQKDGQWFTPPIKDGLLPGIWREFIINEWNANIQSITKEDLLSADQLVIGNSVMGTIKVDSIEENPSILS